MSYKMSVDLNYIEKKSKSVNPQNRYGVNMGNFNNPGDPYASQPQSFSQPSNPPPNVPINTTFKSPNDRPVIVWLNPEEYTLVSQLGAHIIQSQGGVGKPDPQTGIVHFKNGSIEEIVKLFALSHYNNLLIAARSRMQQQQQAQQNTNINQTQPQPRKTYHQYGRPQS